MNESVLVVGAGPVGLMAALELSRRGTQVEIIDQGEGPTPLHESRALAVHGRTLDIFAQNGLDVRLMAKGVQVREVEIRFDGRVLGRIDLAKSESDRPYILSVRQGETERLLIDALSQRGVVVLWKTRCVEVEEPARPKVVVSGPDGDTRVLFPSMVVGADGAHSVVREAMGVGFGGESEPQQFGLLDARLNAAIDPSVFVLNRTYDYSLVRIPMGERFVRYVSNRADVEPLIPEDAGVSEITWRSSFRISYRHVTSFRKGRLFLMGDAAHVHSPAGGRGMNLGMEDAAWFAYACEHDLLDGYSAARLPIAKATLRFSRQQTAQITTRNRILLTGMRYGVPLALKLKRVQRLAARTILAEEQPRPPFEWS